MGIGLGEFVIVLLVAFIVVGPEDLPKVAQSCQNTGALGKNGKKNDERYQRYV